MYFLALNFPRLGSYSCRHKFKQTAFSPFLASIANLLWAWGVMSTKIWNCCSRSSSAIWRGESGDPWFESASHRLTYMQLKLNRWACLFSHFFLFHSCLLLINLLILMLSIFHHIWCFMAFHWFFIYNFLLFLVVLKQFYTSAIFLIVFRDGLIQSNTVGFRFLTLLEGARVRVLLFRDGLVLLLD